MPACDACPTMVASRALPFPRMCSSSLAGVGTAELCCTKRNGPQCSLGCKSCRLATPTPRTFSSCLAPPTISAVGVRSDQFTFAASHRSCAVFCDKEKVWLPWSGGKHSVVATGEDGTKTKTAVTSHLRRFLHNLKKSGQRYGMCWQHQTSCWACAG